MHGSVIMQSYTVWEKFQSARMQSFPNVAIYVPETMTTNSQISPYEDNVYLLEPNAGLLQIHS